MTKINISCNSEFSADMVLAVPYAYWLHKNGMLGQTVSTIDSKSLYYFSDNHIEHFKDRTIDMKISLKDVPNKWIHGINPQENPGVLDFSQWEFPPYKEYYKNDEFIFDKPLCVVSNKYSMEWGENPINFLDIKTLYELFDYLSKDYTVVYKRPRNTEYASDQNENHYVGDIEASVDDFGLINDYKLAELMEVMTFQSLVDKYDNLSYNELQFKLFANCDNYISVQGGNSHICAAFGKTNINYIVRGKELRDGYFNDGTWYKKMNNCNTILTRTYEELLNVVRERY